MNFTQFVSRDPLLPNLPPTEYAVTKLDDGRVIRETRGCLHTCLTKAEWEREEYHRELSRRWHEAQDRYNSLNAPLAKKILTALSPFLGEDTSGEDWELVATIHGVLLEEGKV